MKPDENYEVLNEEIEIIIKEIGDAFTRRMPDGWGFSFIASSIGENGSTFYVSNLQRTDMIKLYREMADKLENGASQ